VVDVFGGTDAKAVDSPGAPARDGGSLRLNAGNQVVWDDRTGGRSVRATEPERAVAWRSGRLEYIDEPLANVVSDVNRYGSRQIRIEDAEAGRLAYTGTVFTGMLDEWLRALPSEFPVRIITDDSSVTIIPSDSVRSQTPPGRP
jgi:transmembrane sensor